MGFEHLALPLGPWPWVKRIKGKKREDRYSPPGQKQMHFCNREEITLNGLPVLLSPLQKGRSDSLIGEDLIKRPMASRIRSFI